jgi:hypothetical protein
MPKTTKRRTNDYHTISDDIWKNKNKSDLSLQISKKFSSYRLVDHILSIRANSKRLTRKHGKKQFVFCYHCLKHFDNEYHECHYCIPCLYCSSIGEHSTKIVFHICWYRRRRISNLEKKYPPLIFTMHKPTCESHHKWCSKKRRRTMDSDILLNYHLVKQIWFDEKDAFCAVKPEETETETETKAEAEADAMKSFIGWLPFEVLADIRFLVKETRH